MIIQDSYPDHLAVCYGCGRLNEHGLKIRSHWDGEEAVAVFEPEPFQIGLPGVAYGGLIASLMDCHAVGTAAAAAAKADGMDPSNDPRYRFVTASLKVNFRKPTPVDEKLALRARALEIQERKVIVAVTLSAGGQLTADGEVIAVRMPETLADGLG